MIYKNFKFENFRTDVKIGIFSIPIVYWSGFGIFEQNWENPDEIGVVEKSANYLIKAWALSIWITYQLKIWKKSYKIKNKLKKEFNDYNEQKEKLIAEIDEIEKQRKNIKKAKSKKQKPKKPSKSIIKPKPK